MKQITISIIALLSVQFSYSQSSTYGPGQKENLSQALSFGFYNPIVEKSIKTLPFSSNEVTYGISYRLKFSERFAFGVEFDFQSSQYKIDQNADHKIFADTIIWAKDKLMHTSFGLSPFLRIYLAPREISEGLHLDLGIKPEIFISKSRVTKDLNKNKVTTRHLKYLNFYRVSAIAKLGYGNVQFYGKYRFTNLFKPLNDSLFPELPRYSFGITIHLNKKNAF